MNLPDIRRVDAGEVELVIVEGGDATPR